MNPSQQAIVRAKVSRDTGKTPEGWVHCGNLSYRHPATGASYNGIRAALERPYRRTCYAYDIHEAAAILISQLSHLRTPKP